MKRQIKKQTLVSSILFITFLMVIGIGWVSVAAAEDESTLSLSLIGDTTIYLQKGTEYKEFGAIAHDSVEGDLSDRIVIDNTVNKDAVGTYTVSYCVSNGADQTATASRTVVVYEGIQNENLYYSKYNSSYSSNTYKRIIQTLDGGFLAIGQSYYSSYYGLYLVKYDVNMNALWSKFLDLYSRNDYFYD